MRSRIISLTTALSPPSPVFHVHTTPPKRRSRKEKDPPQKFKQPPPISPSQNRNKLVRSLTKYQAYKHKPRSPTANCPKTHTPTQSPTPRSCTSRPGARQRASRRGDRSGSRARPCLGKGAPKRLAGAWKRRGCEQPPRGVVAVGAIVALDVRRGEE